MEKVDNFTQFEQKKAHISLCIIVYLCTIATVTVHICTATVACAFIILLISVRPFFSLSSPCATNSVNSSSSFSSDAHKHIGTNKSTHTQTNQHTQTNREMGQCLTGTIGAWLLLVHAPFKACRSESGLSVESIGGAWKLRFL